MKKTLILLLTFFCTYTLWAQEPTVFENKVYKDNLRTVNLHITNSPLSYPIVSLASQAGVLVLYFDDVDAEVKDFTYTVQLCNQDWTVSDLGDMEYLEGFTEGDIRDYNFSQRVSTNFVHYRVELPNRDVRWTKSGNYILKVYENTGGGDKELVITRRFMVTESIAKVQETIDYPVKVNLQQTHQEIDFKVVFQKGVDLKNPIKEVSATILQNGRWDNAISHIQPMQVRDQTLKFDYNNKIVFPASKEWRRLDMRSLENRSNEVYRIDELDDGFDVILYPDKKRTYKAHHSRIDLNGKYVVQNQDVFRGTSGGILNQNNTTDSLSQLVSIDPNQERRNSLQSDYALVYFSLESPTEYYDDDIYVYGALTNWELMEEFKMEYLPKDQAYTTQAWLKQGYYDYMYAYVKEGATKPDLSALEGDWYETKNDYTILVYYRPFGQGYDRLVAVQHSNTGI